MQKPIFRLDEIMRLCKDKSVLHLGYVQHSHLYDKLIAQGVWVHANLAKVSKEIVGIDYLEEDTRIIREKYGFEGYFGDANKLEDVPLNRTFDVIVCGELIEHITNPGLMLEGIKRFMHPDSILIITTPNASGRDFTRKMKMGQLEASWINPEHVSWYSHFTLKNMLGRHGYDEVNYGYYFGFETEARYYIGTPGIRGIMGKLKRKWIISSTRPQNQMGLFFVSRIKS
ncbi:MAG: class I SAM-dependent methyltransferase [Bacteroidetes bacterium]|nr:class I SAM-dependent methyltransferase [Bacteroidota bacterium]